jgi:DNA-binding beta-propeller fold protein YncE
MTPRFLRQLALALGALACAGILAGGALPAAQKLPPGVVASIETIPGGYPLSVATAYGSVWVSQHRQTVLYRISPRTNKIVATIDIGREACGVLTAGYGKVWMPRCNEPNGFVIIDATKNRVAKVVRNAHGLQVAVGAGSFWVPGLNGTTQRYDPKTLKPTATLPVGGFLAFDGKFVWALNPDDGVLRQIDPATNEVAWSTAVPERYWFSYLVVLDGQLWFGSDAPALARLDLATKEFVPVPIKAQPNLGDRPLAVGAGGLWWRTSFTKVSRIDPKTGKVTGTFPTASHGMQAVGFGALWVANSGDSTVWRDRIPK